MKIDISGNKNNSSQNKLLLVQKLDDNSQWLKSLVPSDMIDRKFFISLYQNLKHDQEFIHLMDATKKLSTECPVKQLSQSTSGSIPDSVYYNKLSKTNEEFGTKFKQLENKLLDQVLREDFHSYKKYPHTHSGFVYFLYYAWSNEYGICLRPDMLYYTIICEMMTHIRKKNKNKVLNFSLEHGEEFTEKQLDTYVNSINDDLHNKEIYETVLSTQFESQPENFTYISKFCFVKMASAYCNYLMSFCGINALEIVGTKEEWENLQETVKGFSKFAPELEPYFVKCVDTISKIILFSFSNCEHSESTKFFEDIFWLEDPCNSGHTHVIKGWFSNFYTDNYESLEDFPSHANYIPYSKKEINKKYIRAVGMTYSNYEDNILYPQYGEIVYEVLHDGIYNVLCNFDNIEVTDEDKYKSMIKSINENLGYIPSDVEITQIYTEKIEMDKSSIQSNFVGRFFETVTYATETTSNVVRENWKTTMMLAVLAGTVGIGAIIAKNLKN